MEMEGNVVKKLVYWGWWAVSKTGGKGRKRVRGERERRGEEMRWRGKKGVESDCKKGHHWKSLNLSDL